MTTATVTSREIAEMLAASADPERLRPKMARLNAWHKGGIFEVLGCGAVNPGVGRGGALVFPAVAKAYAAVLDELAETGADTYEIGLVVGGFGIEELETGRIGRAMRGEETVWLFWRLTAGGVPLVWQQEPGNQIPIQRRLTTAPGLPDGWPSGRWLNLTQVFARARE